MAQEYLAIDTTDVVIGDWVSVGQTKEYEELASPLHEPDRNRLNLLPPDIELLRDVCSESTLARKTAQLTTSMLHLARQLQVAKLKIHGLCPLSSTVDKNSYGQTLLGWLSEQQPRTPGYVWEASLKAGRVLVNGEVQLDGSCEVHPGVLIECSGDSTGSVVAAVAAATGTPTGVLVEDMVSYLAPNENRLFNGFKYAELVDWERVNLPSSSWTWEALLQRLKETAMAEDTGADHLLLIAAAHVKNRPLLLWHSEREVAIRFVADDAERLPSADTGRAPCSEMPLGFHLEAHPPPGEAWIKLALVKGDHYVYTPPVELEAATLAEQLEEDEKCHAIRYSSIPPGASREDITAGSAPTDISADGCSHTSCEGITPSLFLLGNTGAGKSCIINILAGRPFYRTERGNAAVLGEQVPGSRIASDESSASETDKVSTHLLKTYDPNEPELMLIDPPGSLDTSGGLVELRNAIGIGMAMRACGPMRVGVVIPENDIMDNNKGEGFVRLAKTLSALFPAENGSFGAAKNMLLIINTKAERSADEQMDEKMQLLLKKLTSIKSARAHDKNVGNFIRAVLDQVRICGKDAIVHFLMYEAQEANGEASKQLLSSYDPAYPPRSPVRLLCFRKEEMIDRILQLPTIRDPANSCALPLSDTARQALTSMLRGSGDDCGDGGKIGVREMVKFSCERRDVHALARLLQLLGKLLRFFKSGSGHATHISAVEELEQEFSDTERAVLQMLALEVGKARVEELCKEIAMPRTVADNCVVTEVCFALNLAGEALVLTQATLLKSSQTWLNPEETASWVCSSLATLTRVAMSSLNDGGFTTESAQERLKFTVLVVAEKLLALRDRFKRAAASSSAAWAGELERVGRCAHDHFEELCRAVGDVQSNLLESVVAGIKEGCATARGAVRSEAEKSGHTDEQQGVHFNDGLSALGLDDSLKADGHDAREQDSTQKCYEGFERSAKSLAALAAVEQILSETMPSLCGKFDFARREVVNEADAAARWLYASLAKVQASDESFVSSSDQSLSSESEPAAETAQEQRRSNMAAMLSIKAELLVLLRMRSSRLHELCIGLEGSCVHADEPNLHSTPSDLDEEPYIPFVHASDVMDGIGSAAVSEHVLDMYYETAVSAVAELHASRCDAALTAARALAFAEQSGAWRNTIELLFDIKQLARVEEMQPMCHASPIWLTVREQHDRLRRIVSISLLSHCETAISRLNDDERRVSYAQHAADLQTLERNLWWDALCGETAIAQAIEKLWGKFAERAETLLRGDDGATALFKRGEHARACSKLAALFEMQPLWHLADGDDGAGDSASANAARHMREMHEEAVADTTAIIDACCQQLSQSVLEVDLPAQPDEQLASAFGKMNTFLQFSNSLATITQWLSLDCIFKPTDGFLAQCKHKAGFEFAKIVRRLERLFRAIADCSSERIMSEFQTTTAGAEELGDEVYSRAASETVSSLAFIKNHDAYPTLFAAVAADAAALEQSAMPHDPNAAFHTLERFFRRSLTRAHQKFGYAHTKPAARFVIVSFIENFNDELDRRNVAILSNAFKAEDVLSIMQQTHAAVARETQKELRMKIIAHDFSAELSAELRQLQESAQLSDLDKHSYMSLCTELRRQVTFIYANQLRRSIMLLQQLESPHTLFEEIVQPWSKLQAAKEFGLQPFLNDAHGTIIELSSICGSQVKLFQDVLNDKLLAKYLDLFEEGDFVSAEHGFHRVLNMVDSLQRSMSSDDLSLFVVARDALCAARDKQRKQLELKLLPLHDDPVHENASAEGTVDGLVSAATIQHFEQWLESCFSLRQMLERVIHEAECKELRSCYRDALAWADAVIPERLASMLAPLLEGNRFLHLSRQQAQLFEMLLRSMWRNQQALCQKHSEIVQRAVGSIKAWHSNAADAPPSIDRFQALTPLQQVIAIRECDPRTETYKDFLKAYHAAATYCRNMLIQAFVKPASGSLMDIADCERLKEMRRRVVFYTDALPSAKPLWLGQMEDVERAVFARCQSLSKNVLSVIGSLSLSLSGPWDTASELVATFVAVFELYALFCDTAGVYTRVQDEAIQLATATNTAPCASQASGAPQRSALQRLKQQCEAQTTALNLHDVLENVAKLLRELCRVTQKQIDCARDATLFMHARDMLSQFQSTVVHGNTKSFFDRVMELDDMSSGQIEADKLIEMLEKALSSAGAETVARIGDRVAAATVLLERPVPYSNNLVLEPTSFAFLFSKETAMLLRSLEEVEGTAELYGLMDAMKQIVITKADEHTKLFEDSMCFEKYDEAKRAVQGYEQLSALLRLDIFKELPTKQFDVESVLRSHALCLAEAAAEQLDTLLAANDGSSDAVLQMVKPVLRMGKLRDGIGERASASIDPLLKEVLVKISNAFGPRGMGTLALGLRESGGVLGAGIVDAAGAFQSIRIEELNNATKKSIEDVRRMFRAANPHSTVFGAETHDALFSNYDEFKRAYDADLDFCIKRAPLQGVNPLAYLVEQARARLLPTSSSRVTGWVGFLGAFGGLDMEAQRKLPRALAAVLAWWTMEFYLNNPQGPGVLNKAALRKANAMQVICMLRLLGASAKGYSPLVNHLAQVPTGEGKSLILGTTATVLALLGYNVRCVCYSSILSTRDDTDFASMFEQFGVADNVLYGTWDELASDLFTEVHGDIRQQAKDFLNGKPYSAATGPRQQSSQRVLLADEVDVFVSKNFMAKTVSYAFHFSSDDITELIKFIWKYRNSDSTWMDKLKENDLYKKVLEKTNSQSAWFYESAIQEQVKVAKKFKRGGRPYQLRDGKVLYKIAGRDEFSDRWTHTYETNCVLLDEADQGNIDEDQIELKIWGTAGAMAYAQLTGKVTNCAPFFSYILGVTGTLDEAKLPPRTHEVLKLDIGISRFTYCDSMYDPGRLDWDPTSRNNVKLALDQEHGASMHEGDHFQAIAGEIGRRRSSGKEPRAVLVFFRHVDKLMRFRDSSYFDAFRETSGIITEEQIRADRNDSIRKATESGVVTLCTAAFGRGTDFKIIDRRVKESGGMHVLSTFFSQEVSEEVQIIGRGGRQGDDGSFSMVLFAKELVDDWPDKVTTESLESYCAGDDSGRISIYRELAKIRAKQSEGKLQEHLKWARERKQQHDEYARLLCKHQQGTDGTAMMALLRKYN